MQVKNIKLTIKHDDLYSDTKSRNVICTKCSIESNSFDYYKPVVEVMADLCCERITKWFVFVAPLNKSTAHWK